MEEGGGFVDFGFSKVEAAKKSAMVGELFSSVAADYDLMNDVMSFGIHRIWKDTLLDLLPDAHNSMLDVAGGTCDVAIRYYKKSRSLGYNPKIVVCDINRQMLEAGQANLIDNNILDAVELVCGDAETLPFPSDSFGYYTIAFGIRNVTNISAALGEAYRVLKPGGKFVCLEFSHPSGGVLSNMYDLYSFKFIPFMGRLIAKNENAYRYLVESIRKFPDQHNFTFMIEKAGFSHVRFRNLSGGIAAIHYGYKV